MQLKHSTSVSAVLFYSLLYTYQSLCFNTNVICLIDRFIRPEDVPVQYGGLSRTNDSQNGPPKPASEFTVKGGEKVNIQIEGIEVNIVMVLI